MTTVKDPLACKSCGVPDEWRLDHYGFLECGACCALDIDTNEHEPDDDIILDFLVRNYYR